MHVRLVSLSLTAVCVAFAALASAVSVQSTASAPIAAMLALDRPNYNGGQSREDRAVAEAIHAAMASRYTERCDAPDPRAGQLLGFSADRANKPLPSLDGVDPDLAALIRALDHPRQEVRDVAAYTIGLLGPSAKDAIPFLEAKFGARNPPKGGWFNFAYARTSCQGIAPVNFRRILPDALIPGKTSDREFDRKSAMLLAALYRDPNYEYPPDSLIGAFQDMSHSDTRDAVALLGQILDDPNLSEQKHLEAGHILLNYVDAEDLKPALPALLNQLRAGNAAIRFFVGYAIVKLKRPEGVALAVESLGQNEFVDWMNRWDREFCAMGRAAIDAEDRLIAIAKNSTWPANERRAIKTLGCIGSTKALPLVESVLTAPDWKLNRAAATAIGAIGTAPISAISTLEFLAQKHWSAIVRSAAESALIRLGARVSSSAQAATVYAGPQEVVIGGSMPYNHGLPWCDQSGRYSIDGKRWFSIAWIKPSMESAPTVIPKRLLQTVGTQTFLRVADGWLMGSDGFEGNGVLVHVSLRGDIQDLERDAGPQPNASIDAILPLHGEYFALGVEGLRAGDDGSLIRLTHSAAGEWRAARILALPGPIAAYGISPTGDILVSDGPNSYAIVHEQIVPLKCDRTFAGSYFSSHPESPYLDD